MILGIITIYTGLPAECNSTGEKVLTRCLTTADALNKPSASNTSLMMQKTFTESEVNYFNVQF